MKPKHASSWLALLFAGGSIAIIALTLQVYAQELPKPATPPAPTAPADPDNEYLKTFVPSADPLALPADGSSNDDKAPLQMVEPAASGAQRQILEEAGDKLQAATDADKTKAPNPGFKAAIATTRGENFIWVEAVHHEDGAIRDGLIFRNCDFTRLKTGTGGSMAPMTEERIQSQLEDFLTSAHHKGLKFNPRWCPVVSNTDAHVYPYKDVIRETSGVRRVTLAILRTFSESAVLVIGNISTNFTWSKSLEWSGATVGAKSFMTLISGDKPIQQIWDELRVSKIPKALEDLYKREISEPGSGKFVTIRVAMEYPKLLLALQGELDHIYAKHCGGIVPKLKKMESDPVCHQWNRNDHDALNDTLDFTLQGTESDNARPFMPSKQK